jgi:hypothetical protein
LEPLFPPKEANASGGDPAEPTGEAQATTSDDEHTVALPYDGRLTSLEAVAEEDRPAVVEAFKMLGKYELFVPVELAHALRMYPTAPGRWLVEPWFDEGLNVDPAVAERHLAQVITDCRHGQSDHSTWVKVAAFAAALRGPKLKLSADLSLVDLLPRYPGGLDEEERAKAEALIRGNFQALAAPPFLGTTRWAEMIAWAQTFWRSNSALFPCRRSSEDSTPEEAVHGEGEAALVEDSGMSPEEFSELADLTEDVTNELRQRFLKAASATDSDLYAPERHEVLTGIVARALRLADAVPTSPMLWTGELSAFFLRAILEARIIFEWLLLNDDPALYEQFQSYGFAAGPSFQAAHGGVRGLAGRPTPRTP